MEISLEAIISLVGLLLGGGGGAFFTWRYMSRKAKAEATSAEIDATKDMQELYKKMLEDANTYLEDARGKVDGLRQERDHYKQDRDELRKQVEELRKEFFEFKDSSGKENSELSLRVEKLNRKVEAMRPFMCGDLTCKKRKLVSIELTGERKPATEVTGTGRKTKTEKS